MKKDRGITLITLTITIIAMVLVISTLSIISNFFFFNKNYLLDNSRNIAEYNKFNMFFIQDVKNNKSAKVTENSVTFEDGTVYSYRVGNDNGIYRNKVKICDNIALCNFSNTTETVNNTTKQIINVHIVVESTEMFETENFYVLKYW